MPELCRLFGIIINMYFNDTQKHKEAHIHAIYNEYEVVVSLKGEILSGHLPNKQFKIVINWMDNHKKELEDAWNNASSGKNFNKISP